MRPAVVVLLLALVLPASAAGTGGISVTPIPAVKDGKPVTSFRVDLPRDGTKQVPFTVRNVEDEPRSARLYVAPVTETDGGFALGQAGASEYVSMPDEVVTLQPGEEREKSFTVTGSDEPDELVHAAVVVEVTNGAVTTQASTLIYLEPSDRVSLPLLLVALAVLLIALAAAAWAHHVRRERAALTG